MRRQFDIPLGQIAGECGVVAQTIIPSEREKNLDVCFLEMVSVLGLTEPVKLFDPFPKLVPVGSASYFLHVLENVDGQAGCYLNSRPVILYIRAEKIKQLIQDVVPAARNFVLVSSESLMNNSTNGLVVIDSHFRHRKSVQLGDGVRENVDKLSHPLERLDARIKDLTPAVDDALIGLV